MNNPLHARDPPIAIDDIDTDSVDTSRAVTAVATDHPNGGLARPEQDASSKIQAIFFRVVAICIGIGTLIVAVLAFRRMPKQKQSNLESPPLGQGSHVPSQDAEFQLTHIQGEPIELDAVQTAVEMQCEEPVIRNLNAGTATQPPVTLPLTG
jgi:hypothetical protein